MSAKKQDIIKRANQWTVFADDDLRIARHAFKLSSSCPYRIIAYHAQQCAEKYLKAFLVYKNVDFPYTHKLSRLLELCLPYGSWVEKLRAAEELTPYAVTARYPEQREKVSKKDALRTIEIASLVKKTMRKIFKQEGLHL
ncbi:MAG: HEPN domain-containing protein [Nitrospirae bacterium]|nr:HEPN domain-containing protein [Nitrospirota bacterium]